MGGRRTLGSESELDLLRGHLLPIWPIQLIKQATDREQSERHHPHKDEELMVTVRDERRRPMVSVFKGEAVPRLRGSVVDEDIIDIIYGD